MTEELLPGARVPATQLTGERAVDYVDTMRRVLRAARLNAFYPDARTLASHIEPLAPEIHQGLYDGVEVDLRTGLPTYREWTRVQTDVQLAAEQLHQLGGRGELARKAAEGAPIWAKQLKKHDYYTAINGQAIAGLGEMNVALRRLDRANGRGSFHVELDKLDASGVFVRYTIDVEQLNANYRDRAFKVDDREIADQTEAFQALIYKFTSLDAEFTFVKLATLGSLVPERVSKGTVGPIWFDFTRAPDDVKPLLEDGGFVACFSLDSAATDIADERNNDPFATLAEDRLSAEGRAGYQQAKARAQYKVFKDRKFVVPRDRVDAMRAICEARGTKNIVYGI